MRSVRSPGSVRLPFGSRPHVSCVCVRSWSRGVCPPPPWAGEARALRAVPVKGPGRAVPGDSSASSFPAPVPCSAYLARGGGGRPGPFVPLPGSGSLAPCGWACVSGAVRRPRGRGGGRLRGAAQRKGTSTAQHSTTEHNTGERSTKTHHTEPQGSEPRRGVVGPGSVGGPRAWGVGSPSSVPLPPLDGHQGWLCRRRLGDGGCGLHTARVRVRVLLPRRCPKGAPRGVLVLWRATGGPGRQAWGSANPLGGGRYRPAGVRAAACGGYGVGGGADNQGARGAWRARRALARRSAPGVAALRRSSPAVIPGSRGWGGAVSWPGGGVQGRRGVVALGSAAPTARGPTRRLSAGHGLGGGGG